MQSPSSFQVHSNPAHNKASALSLFSLSTFIRFHHAERFLTQCDSWWQPQEAMFREMSIMSSKSRIYQTPSLYYWPHNVSRKANRHSLQMETLFCSPRTHFLSIRSAFEFNMLSLAPVTWCANTNNIAGLRFSMLHYSYNNRYSRFQRKHPSFQSTY